MTFYWHMIRSSFVIGLALLPGTLASPSACDGGSCRDAPDSDPTDLYLLQRKAQVIRKPTKEARHGDLKPSPKVSAIGKIAKHAVGVSQTATQLHLKDRRPHSRSSAFITAAFGKVAPLSQKQRLSMLSATEVSGFSETWKMFFTGLCASVVLALGCAMITLVATESKFGRIFRRTIEDGIATIADDILGLDVTVGSLSVGVLEGKVLITDLKIANPPNFKTDKFLNAGRVDVRVNLWSCAWKHFFGKNTCPEVDSIVFQDVDLNVEKGTTSSNLQDICDMMTGAKEKPERATTSKKGEKERKLTLHKMTIKDMGAIVPSMGRIAVPAVHCPDFDKATDGKARTVRPIVAEVLQELCRSGEWAGGFAQASKTETGVCVEESRVLEEDECF